MKFRTFKKLKTHKPASPQSSTLETAGTLYSSGKYTEAMALVEQLLKTKPQDAGGLNLAAACSFARGDLKAAEKYLLKAVQVAPDNAEIHNNIGNLLVELKRAAAAETSYQRAISLRPDHAMAFFNLGNLLLAQERFTEAESAYRRALSIRPDYVEAHNNLGNVFKKQKRFAEAEEAYGRALSIRPDHAKAHNNMGGLRQEQKRFTEAEEAYGRALSIRPAYAEAHCRLLHLHRCMCRWAGLKNEVSLLLDSIATNQGGYIVPFILLSIPEIDLRQQRDCARQYAERILEHYLLHTPFHRTTPKAITDRLRIGYLSADFNTHPTSFLLAEVMELHDQQRFETLGYSCGPDDNTSIQKRIRGAFTHCYDIRTLSCEAAAQKIADDRVDILVDLMGYTNSGLPQVFALRPAPVQVNWLGYPGTMGHERLADYLIGDPVVTPLTHAAYYSETLALMPHCYQPNDRKRQIGPSPARDACNLPEQGFVFCSFNQSVKITPAVFDLWCRLLEAVPGSVLWLLYDRGGVQENLRREAALQGITPERLVFTGQLPLTEHLARLRLADLMLDTFPYTSHTTASDALWVGLPLVTCIGETFASRVAASLLYAAKMPELITTTFDDYFRLALDLATHPDKLATIRDTLEQHRLTCPLFDSTRFTRDLERLYEQMWADHLSGRKKTIHLADEQTSFS